jgi:hypothetical protein
VSALGTVTASQFVTVLNKAVMSDVARQIYVASSAPPSNQGNIGDIWYQTF